MSECNAHHPEPIHLKKQGDTVKTTSTKEVPVSGTQRLIRYLRLPDLIEKIGISRSTIYNKMDQSCKYFDPTFPKARRIGANTVAWLESEIEAWMLAR